jgi:hypothetical protein
LVHVSVSGATSNEAKRPRAAPSRKSSPPKKAATRRWESGGSNRRILLVLGPVVLALLGCLWPLVGVVTYGSAISTRDYLIAPYPGHDIIAVSAMFAVGGGALYLTIKIERRP